MSWRGRLAATAVGRFLASGASDVVVADALARLAEVVAGGGGGVARAERLLSDWRAQLATAAALLAGADAGVREAWLWVAGLALALSAVAGGLGVEPVGPREGEVLAAAVFCHAVGALHVQAELARQRRAWAFPMDADRDDVVGALYQFGLAPPVRPPRQRTGRVGQLRGVEPGRCAPRLIRAESRPVVRRFGLLPPLEAQSGALSPRASGHARRVRRSGLRHTGAVQSLGPAEDGARGSRQRPAAFAMIGV